MPEHDDDSPLFDLTEEDLATLKAPSTRGGGWSRKPGERRGSWAHNNLRYNKIDVRMSSEKARGDAVSGIPYTDYDPRYDHTLLSWKSTDPKHIEQGASPLSDDEVREALKNAPPELVKEAEVPVRKKGQLRLLNRYWKSRSFAKCATCGGYDVFETRCLELTRIYVWCFRCGAKDSAAGSMPTNIGGYKPPSVKEKLSPDHPKEVWRAKDRAQRIHNILWCLRQGISDPLAITIKLREFGDLIIDRSICEIMMSQIARIVKEDRKRKK